MEDEHLHTYEDRSIVMDLMDGQRKGWTERGMDDQWLEEGRIDVLMDGWRDGWIDEWMDDG